MDIEMIKSSISNAVDSLDVKFKDSLSFLKDMKEMAADKLNNLVNDILGLAPLIEVTGFSMREVSVEAGFPTGITLNFIKEKDMDADTIEQMLDEHKDQQILSLIVRGLQKADNMQKGMNLSHYKFRGLSMKIGLPPDISLKFTRLDETN